MFNFEREKNELAERLVEKGVRAEHAQTVAESMACADAYGVTSHGSAMLDAHIARILRGGYNLEPDIRIIRESCSFAVVDGDNSIGPVSAEFCTDYAVKRAKESGVFTVFSRNNNTFGPAFYYSLKAAEQGCIAIIASNSPAQMAPPCGKEKLLGTNPFAVVVPIPDEEPIIIDMATSVVAKSKFKEYKQRGEQLPEGWALDRNGKPTTDPDEAMAGFVLPMAGYKGYAIAMLIDILAGLTSGAASLDRVGRFYAEDSSSMNVGFVVTAINPQIVLGEAYGREIKEYARRIRESASVDGGKITLPGADRIEKYKSNGKTK